MATKLEMALSMSQELEAKIEAAKTPEDILVLVREQIPDYTLDELKADLAAVTIENGELSDVDLESVAGGRSWGDVDKDKAKKAYAIISNIVGK
jgi:hypothetical protein